MFEVIKNASCKVWYHENKDTVQLYLAVENKEPHLFPLNASENKLIQQMSLKTIEEKFNGGTYVFNGNKLINYKDSTYNGFVRTTEDINILSDVIGSESYSGNRERGVNGMFEQFRGNSIDKSTFLGGVGEIFELEVDNLGEGGVFENKLIYSWSPFDENLLINLEAERLVCNNGMVGMASFVTKAVPLVNRYEENLEVVTIQLQPQFNSILGNRFSDMSHQPASLHSMMQAHNLINNRLKQNNSILRKTSGFDLEQEKAVQALREMNNVLNVKNTLGGHYKSSAFSNKEQARHLQGNLTQYDVFNILTEAVSHSSGDSKSNEGIQKAINSIIFDDLNDKKSVKGNVPNLSSESDHRRAFFGKN